MKLLTLVQQLVGIVPPTNEEKRSIERLRAAIRALPTPEAGSSADGTKWLGYQRALRDTLLKRDPRHFLRSEVIANTMFHGAKEVELRTLEASPSWDKWRHVVTKDPFGSPPPYAPLPDIDGNSLHQLYSLSQLPNGADAVRNMHTVVEFGGGYGSMCKLIYGLGFTGRYTIYDLPEFLALQEYYFSNTGVPLSSIALVQEPGILAQHSNPDLCIALWSLSESPLELRQQVLAALGSPKQYLIAYQEHFSRLDNVAYFAQFVAERPEYRFMTAPIPHLPGNHYLLGTRI